VGVAGLLTFQFTTVASASRSEFKRKPTVVKGSGGMDEDFLMESFSCRMRNSVFKNEDGNDVECW
jgi:hypothetical protein